MPKLIFNGSKRSINKLAKIDDKINNFLKKHPKKFNRSESKKYRKLSKKHAKALSKATGMKIHSLFD